jgi:hypothetical protein
VTETSTEPANRNPTIQYQSTSNYHTNVVRVFTSNRARGNRGTRKRQGKQCQHNPTQMKLSHPKHAKSNQANNTQPQKKKIRSGFTSKEIKQAARGQIGTRRLGKGRPNRTPGHHLLPRSQRTALNEFKISNLIRKNESFSAHESKPEGRRRTHGDFIERNRQASDQ